MRIRKPKSGRIRIQPYIDRGVVRRLRELCALRNVTESSMIEAALEHFLNGTTEAATIGRGLGKLGQQTRALHADIEIFMLAFGSWTKSWFAHLPTLSDEASDAAGALARSRYARFVEYVAEEYVDGRRFINDLPSEIVGGADRRSQASGNAGTPDDRGDNDGGGSPDEPPADPPAPAR